MKRTLTILAMIFAAATATAQQPTEEIVKSAEAPTTTATTTPLTDSTSIVLRTDEHTSTLNLELGGFVISIGSPEKQARRSKFAIGSYNADLGPIYLVDEGYEGYPAEDRGFLLLGRKSSHFATTVFNYSLRLNDSRVPTAVRFYTGLRLSTDRISLSSPDLTLGNDASGRVVPIALDKEYKKSQYFVEGIGIPIGLSIHHRPSRIAVDVSVINSINYTQGTIYKKPKTRNRSITGTNPYHCAVRVAVNLSSIGFYTEYSLTPLFKKGVGPQGNIFSLGATINIGGISL